MDTLNANPYDAGYVLLPWRAIGAGATRMKRGLEDHARDSWRRLSYEENLDHALAHLGSLLMGDKSEDHLLHAMLRLMMAVEVRESEPSPPSGV